MIVIEKFLTVLSVKNNHKLFKSTVYMFYAFHDTYFCPGSLLCAAKYVFIMILLWAAGTDEVLESCQFLTVSTDAILSCLFSKCQ